jgi:hypothetical protein
MSNVDVSTEILESMGMEEDDLIRWVLGKTFLVDFGFVVAVMGSPATSVDVKHAAHAVIVGQEQPDTITKGVEVMWPGGGLGLSMSWNLAVGDAVLLLALKDDVSLSRTTPAKADTPMHYTQETLKAVPLGRYNSGAGFLINVDSSNLLQVKNASASLFTVLNNLISDLSTFATGLNPTTLAAQAAALVTALASVTTALGQLMKA